MEADREVWFIIFAGVAYTFEIWRQSIFEWGRLVFHGKKKLGSGSYRNVLDQKRTLPRLSQKKFNQNGAQRRGLLFSPQKLFQFWIFCKCTTHLAMRLVYWYVLVTRNVASKQSLVAKWFSFRFRFLETYRFQSNRILIRILLRSPARKANIF